MYPPASGPKSAPVRFRLISLFLVFSLLALTVPTRFIPIISTADAAPFFVDPVPSVAVNKYFNSGTAAGDIVELLVIQNSLDMRGMIIKDFSASMVNDGGGKFTFTNNALWAAVPSGTLIVLRNNNSAADVTVGGGDFNLDLGLTNTTYFTSGGGAFDIAGVEMVMIKAAGSGTAGVTGSIHALAGGTAGAQFTSAPTPKLIASGQSGTNQFVYANNSTQSIADFNGTDATGAATGLTFGSGNNANNTAYINSLRSGATPTPTPPPTPGALQFSAATYSVNEGGGSATITVTRTGGSDGTVTVNYATSDGTATSGDYTSAAGTLTFVNGDTSETFSVPVIDDGAVEGNESVNLALSSPTGGATLGSPNAAVLTIVDNDVAPTPTPTPTPTPATNVIINELDSDTPGADAAEFIELYDGGVGNTSLNGLVLVLYTGSSDTSYAAFDLDGFTTNAAGYFTIGNPGVPGVDLTFNPGASGFLQNGEDAAALYAASASDFPNGTAVTATNLIDAVVYDTNDADDPGLLGTLTPGQPQINEGAGSGNETNSIQRCPNGSGGALNTTTYTTAAPSADSANVCIPPTPTPTPTPNPTPTPAGEAAPAVLFTSPSANNTIAARDASIVVGFTEPVNVTGQWYHIQCATTGVHNSATVAGGPSTYTITPNVNFINGEQCTVTIEADLVTDQDSDDGPTTNNMLADHTWSFSTSIFTPPVTGPPHPPEVHLTMGNPSDAVNDPGQPNNYLMVKPEYALSYNRDRGTPNWVSWHLADEWVGSLVRDDTFRPDPSVLPEWYRVLGTDYSGSGFDRGHMVPNADRDEENSRPVNQATFLMSNIIPQAPDNNQGPWADMENDLRSIMGTTNELYIVAGGHGTGGTGSNGFATTITNGHVTVPNQTWKVVLVLSSAPGDDTQRATCATRTIAVIMPNTQGIRNNDWQSYLTTVDAVEALTGYDFFENLPDPVERCVEAGINGVNPPLDTDADGVPDSTDNCDFDANPNQSNFDGDAQGDACDPDDDNDGASDAAETAAGSNPLNPASTPEICDGVDNDLNDGIDEGYPDANNDGQADCVDTDDDGDGFSDAAEITAGSDPLNANSTPEVCDGIDNDLNDGVDEGFTNTDGDGQSDCVDNDDDNDGATDAAEIAAGSDPLNAASTPEVCDGLDNDLNDGVDEGFTNTDGDGQADCVDTDDDNDGVSDSAEITAGSDPLNAASTPEVCDGIDNDLNDGVDEGFTNTDGDTQADCVDADDDNDGVSDAAEIAAGSDPLNNASRPEVCDGIDNDLNEGVDEGFANTDGDAQANCVDTDDDGDGVSDAAETAAGSDPLNANSTPEVCDGVDNDLNDGVDEGFVNTDGDAQANCVDADDDNDGTPDAQDAFPLNPNESVDTDGDGIGNNADPDDDNDGVSDGQDAFPLNPNESVDTDHDGIGNNADFDDDNDGVLDGLDNCPLIANPNQADFDNDGVGDTCDPVTGPPTNKEQCKNGGWQRFDSPRRFKNQGDCIQFVNTGK